jgi:hypothetical protein
MQKLPLNLPDKVRGNRRFTRCLRTVLAAAFLVLAQWVSAATFNAELDRDTVTLGETATLSLKFTGGTPQAIPTPPQIARLSIDYVGRSSQFSDINGQVSSTVSHNFNLKPHQAGEFIIPPMTVDISGEKLTSQPLKLKVINPAPASPQAINSGSQLAFLKLGIPKKQLYLGETIVAQLDLYLHSNVRNIGNFQAPSFNFEGCNVGKIVQGTQRRVQVGNTVYTVLPLAMPVKPIRTGTLNLGAVTVSFVAQLSSGRQGRDLFEQFGLLGGEQKQLTVVSEPDTLQCLPLPKENVPASFKGAVGNFTMNVSAGPTNVAVGDPITIRVQLTGKGAFDTLNLPDQFTNEDFKAYPPSVKATETSDQFGLQGSKTFEQVVVPQNAEVKELPPISFSFFDPEQASYHTLTQPALKLLVRPGAASPQPTITTANRRAEQESPPPAQDIVPIKTRLGTVAQIGAPLIEQPWFLALQSVPVLALISSVIIRRRADNYANNPKLRRQKQVAQIVRDGLIELQRFAAENKSDEFFAGLFRLLQEQLGERLNLPAFSITEAVIEEHLKPRHVPEATLNQVQQLFQSCNLARYAPIRSSQELAAFIPRLETTLRELQSLNL